MVKAENIRTPLIWICYGLMLVDLFYTTWAIQHGAVEMNVLIRSLVSNFTLNFIFKILVVPVLLLIFVFVSGKHPRFRQITLLTLAGYAGIIAIYDATVLYRVMA